MEPSLKANSIRYVVYDHTPNKTPCILTPILLLILIHPSLFLFHLRPSLCFPPLALSLSLFNRTLFHLSLGTTISLSKMIMQSILGGVPYIAIGAGIYCLPGDICSAFLVLFLEVYDLTLQTDHVLLIIPIITQSACWFTTRSSQKSSQKLCASLAAGPSKP